MRAECRIRFTNYRRGQSVTAYQYHWIQMVCICTFFFTLMGSELDCRHEPIIGSA